MEIIIAIVLLGAGFFVYKKLDKPSTQELVAERDSIVQHYTINPGDSKNLRAYKTEKLIDYQEGINSIISGKFSLTKAEFQEGRGDAVRRLNDFIQSEEKLKEATKNLIQTHLNVIQSGEEILNGSSDVYDDDEGQNVLDIIEKSNESSKLKIAELRLKLADMY